MNSDEQNVIVRTRRALNCLQHSPNGKSIVGISPRKSNRKKVTEKKKLAINWKKVSTIQC